MTFEHLRHCRYITYSKFYLGFTANWGQIRFFFLFFFLLLLFVLFFFVVFFVLFFVVVVFLLFFFLFCFFCLFFFFTYSILSVFDKSLYSAIKQFITKTCLYNFDPLKPHFYIVKLGFTGVNIIFLISAENIDCGTRSNEYPQSMFSAVIWKITDHHENTPI